ncbi:hypothetical protein EIP91_001436 [Steccherinum ochraceum]|uniref:Uncharacterized protein n=1 Tax=Steccherinum ochraceum TaxID=92696 RepID=A0A4V2MWI4_9APHY|nr:hypothetical protein EIP91_001436 [Steccherinum ochraceum]
MLANYSKLIALISATLPIAQAGVVGLFDRAGILATHEEIVEWITTTDANITYVGAPIDFTKRAAQDTMVVYCSSRTQNVCGGPCTVYNGNAACLNAPNTNCLRATTNVGFCDRAGCGGSCNQFSSCGTVLDDGFCATPGTKSINVPFT